MNKFSGKRLLYGGLGGVLALLFLFITVSVQAQDLEVNENINPEDCASCHEEVVGQWEGSAHATEELLYGNLFTGPMVDRNKVSAEVGGATCDTCHWLGELSPSHPEMVMETDMSAALCGSCHQETVAEWENSTHGDQDIACVRCHSPHNTSIRADSVQSLCYRCHTKEAHFYNNTVHAEENLLCTDCHLGLVEESTEAVAGGTVAIHRHHTFNVGLNTCNECHADEMHDPTATATSSVITSTLAGTTDPPITQVLLSNLNLEPVNVSPMSVILVLMAGILLGVFLAPQVEGRLRGSGRLGEWMK